MNVNRLFLAVLPALCVDASAQSSSVTLSGVIDVNGRYARADGRPRMYSESTDGLNSCELIFRGVEDLGGGLKASFDLRSAFNADQGTAGANAKFWHRRSTVSLISDTWGELRLGRDFLPSLVPLALFDAYGFVGMDGSANVSQMFGGLRSDNAISYFTPKGLAGFYGQVMVAAAEGGTTNVGGSSFDKPGTRYIGGRAGYAAGPFDVSFATAGQRYTNNASIGGIYITGTYVGTILAGQTQRSTNVAGSWDFGFLKLFGFYDRETVPNFRGGVASLSTVIPFGVSQVRLGYDRSTLKRSLTGTTTTLDMLAASYTYNFSKRTAVYAQAARLDNKDNTNFTVQGASGNVTPGGQSLSAALGIRHIF